MKYIEFQKPIRFCSMTFLKKKIELGGIISSLQVTFDNVKG
jgi:hypothetical protein